MNKCLNCEKDYEPKRDASKFCSANCRVKYHRKHGGKKKEVNPIQVQALFNAMMEMVDKMGGKIVDVSSTTKFYDEPKIENTWQDEPNMIAVQKRQPKSAAQYISEKRELEDPELYKKWFEELESDPYLTKAVKQQIKIA